jgi:signal peptidase I
MIYRTRGEHANHFTTDAVHIQSILIVNKSSYLNNKFITSENHYLDRVYNRQGDIKVMRTPQVEELMELVLHHSVQTKDYKIGICCFSTKHAALRRKSIVWLVQNRDNVSEWGDMSIHRLLFQCVRFLLKNFLKWHHSQTP